MDSSGDPEWDQIRSHIREHVRELFRHRGLQRYGVVLPSAKRGSPQQNADGRLGEDKELSGPRWRLLMRLLIEERRGDSTGCTPTDLSQSQRVGKNTISALLRGLEAQGLIRRSLDPADLRTFRIQLTQFGRDYLHGAAPARVENLNRLFSKLDLEQQARLTELLETLRRSLLAALPSGLEGRGIPNGRFGAGRRPPRSALTNDPTSQIPETLSRHDPGGHCAAVRSGQRRPGAARLPVAHRQRRHSAGWGGERRSNRHPRHPDGPSRPVPLAGGPDASAGRLHPGQYQLRQLRPDHADRTWFGQRARLYPDATPMPASSPG